MSVMSSSLKDWQVDIPDGESGDWAVKKFKVTSDEASMHNLREAINGRSRLIYEGEFTKLTHHGRIVMSDTPAECMDHFEPVNMLEKMMAAGSDGTAIINGLGLGMVVARMLDLGASHIDVVEIDQDVINLVAEHLTKKYGDRITIHHRDALEGVTAFPKDARWDVAWHDIWPTITEDNLPDMARLHRSFARRVEWQGSWLHDECKRIRERSRRGGWW